MKIESLNDLTELIRKTDYLKLPTENFLFVHKETKDKIRLILDELSNGKTAYLRSGTNDEPFKEFFTFMIAGYTFHVTTAPNERPEYIAHTIEQIDLMCEKIGYEPLPK